MRHQLLQILYAHGKNRRMREAEEVTKAAKDFDGQVETLKEAAKKLVDAFHEVSIEYEKLSAIAGNPEWPLNDEIKKIRKFFDTTLSKDFIDGKF